MYARCNPATISYDDLTAVSDTLTNLRRRMHLVHAGTCKCGGGRGRGRGEGAKKTDSPGTVTGREYQRKRCNGTKRKETERKKKKGEKKKGTRYFYDVRGETTEQPGSLEHDERILLRLEGECDRVGQTLGASVQLSLMEFQFGGIRAVL